MNSNNTGAIIGVIVIVLIILFGGWYLFMQPTGSGTTATSTATSTTSGNTVQQTQSDGTITFTVPTDFGLATTQNQILVQSNIPPCDQGFEYCLYYNNSTYQGTNFDSAGLSIKKRADLASEQTCLNTPPAGFASSTKPDKTSSVDTYAASVFSQIGNSAAGHAVQGTLYRLFVRSNSSCYEFQTRIATTDIGNLPAGSPQFTSGDQTALTNEMNQLLRGVSLGSTPMTFPGL